MIKALLSAWDPKSNQIKIFFNSTADEGLWIFLTLARIHSCII